MAEHEIFISYSHHDVHWRRRLDAHLGIFRYSHIDSQERPAVGIRFWSDEDIATGAFWEREIELAITRAKAAVLLISPHFLSSEFIMTREVPLIREKKKSEDLAILPFIIRPCPWQAFDWISELNIFRRSEALSTLSESDQDDRLTQLFFEIETYLRPPTDETTEEEVETAIAESPLPPIELDLGRDSPVQVDIESMLPGNGPRPSGEAEFRFMDVAALAEFLAGQGHAPMIGAVKIFDTSKQHTWIAATPERVICILDSESTFFKGRLIQWTMPTIPVPRVRARRSGKRKLSGLVDIGGRQNWLFSLPLFGDDPQRLEAALNALLSQAAGAQ